MAKILKKAIDNPELWNMEVTCTGKGWYQNGKQPCYSLLEIYPYDILKRSSTDISGISDTYYGFICPKCGCFTELDTSKIPSHILTNTRQYTEQ